jgi:hypothetical protein
MRDRTRVPVVATTAILTLALVSMPAIAEAMPVDAVAAKSKPLRPKPKPDLVVRGLTFQTFPLGVGSPLAPSVVIGPDGMGTFALTIKVRNVGKGDSRTGDVTIETRGLEFPAHLGKVAAGKSKKVTKPYTYNYSDGPGFYDVSVCGTSAAACSKSLKFAAIPQRWIVDSFAERQRSVPIGGGSSIVETYADEGLTFEYAGTTVNDGVPHFVYLASGGLIEDLYEQTSTCTTTGRGSVSHVVWDGIEPQLGELEIAPGLNSYFAEMKDYDYKYTTTEQCEGGGPVASPQDMNYLSTDWDENPEFRTDQPMSPATRTLEGGGAVPGFDSVIVGWSFRADIP